MKKALMIPAALLLLCALPGSAMAYKFWGAKPLGMGGAFTAVADTVNAMYWNPAGIHQLKAYGFQFNYERHEHLLGDYKFLYRNEIEEAQDDGRFIGDSFFDDGDDIDFDKKKVYDVYNFSIVDGKTTAPYLTWGLGFTSQDFTGTFQDATAYSVDLSMASGVEDFIFFGLDTRWQAIEQLDDSGHFNFDLGSLVRAGEFVGVGLVGRNLLGSDEPMIVRREIALGVAGHALEYATISAEATKVFDVGEDDDVAGTFNWAAGVEGHISIIALRGGFTADMVSDRRLYSLGIAAIDDNGILSYSFQGDTGEVKNFSHSIQLVFLLL